MSGTDLSAAGRGVALAGGRRGPRTGFRAHGQLGARPAQVPADQLADDRSAGPALGLRGVVERQPLVVWDAHLPRRRVRGVLDHAVTVTACSYMRQPRIAIRVATNFWRMSLPCSYTDAYCVATHRELEAGTHPCLASTYLKKGE